MNSTKKRPHIIFYFSDQQRADTLGCYGQKLNVTPNLDKLAQEGTRFSHAYTCQPVCGPARACIQSGLYATEIGCYRNAISLPTDIPTIAKELNAHGYDTAYVGKWHLASDKEFYTSPFDEHNFDFRGIPEKLRGGYKDYWMASDVLEGTSHGYDGYVFDENNKRRDFIGYRPTCINEFAIHYLHTRKSDNPLFLFISQIEPHHQNDHDCFEGPDGSKEKFKDFEVPIDLQGTQGDWRENMPDYLGQCHSLDENLGRFIDSLKESGLWENTILFYCSDHGCHFKTRNSEYKRSCHASSTHIPLIAVGGPFDKGGVIDDMVSLIDIPSTILSCAGIEIPQTFQGNSLKDLVQGTVKDWPKEVFIQISESQVGRALRTKDWTYSVRAIDKNGWTDASSTVYREDFLYDLQSDPGEHHNLVADEKYAEKRKELSLILLSYMKKAHEEECTILPFIEEMKKEPPKFY